MEKRTHFRRGAIHALGMPLNSEGERMSGKFDCLNDAVRGTGADSTTIKAVDGANLANATMLKSQIVDFMKYRAPIAKGNGCLQWFC